MREQDVRRVTLKGSLNQLPDFAQNDSARFSTWWIQRPTATFGRSRRVPQRGREFFLPVFAASRPCASRLELARRCLTAVLGL